VAPGQVDRHEISERIEEILASEATP